MPCLHKKMLSLIALLFISTFAQASESRYQADVVPLIQSHEYFQSHPAPTYWKMAPYYVRQRNDYSCSSASAAMMVNTLQSKKLVDRKSTVAIEAELLQKVHDKTWSKGTNEGGDGATLDQMLQFLPKAFAAYGLKGFKVEATHVKNQSKEQQKALHNLLMKNEASGKSFLLVNFEHKLFTKGSSVGHFSPVAAYDAGKKRVLIMDVYRKEFAPYWVPEKLLLAAMNTMDSDAKKYRGYLLIQKAKDQ